MVLYKRHSVSIFLLAIMIVIVTVVEGNEKLRR
jgi:hypothetical protein